MNERIKELAKQAGAHWYHGDFNMGCSVEFQEGDLDKFAELIVRECVEQCNVNFVGTVGTHPNAHNRGVKKCIDNIKEHFGVE